jgi:hypothetical protein
MGRESPIRLMTTMSDYVAPRQAGIGQEQSFAEKKKTPHSGGAAWRCWNKLMAAASVSEVKIG